MWRARRSMCSPPSRRPRPETTAPAAECADPTLGRVHRRSAGEGRRRCGGADCGSAAGRRAAQPREPAAHPRRADDARRAVSGAGKAHGHPAQPARRYADRTAARALFGRLGRFAAGCDCPRCTGWAASAHDGYACELGERATDCPATRRAFRVERAQRNGTLPRHAHAHRRTPPLVRRNSRARSSGAPTCASHT
jgi:hypothetical protein